MVGIYSARQALLFGLAERDGPSKGLGLGRIAYFRLLRRFGFRHLRAIVFDQMLPKIAHYWPRATVEQLMREQGLLDLRLIWVNKMSWCAIGRKPAR